MAHTRNALPFKVVTSVLQGRKRTISHLIPLSFCVETCAHSCLKRIWNLHHQTLQQYRLSRSFSVFRLFLRPTTHYYIICPCQKVHGQGLSRTKWALYRHYTSNSTINNNTQVYLLSPCNSQKFSDEQFSITKRPALTVSAVRWKYLLCFSRNVYIFN